MGTSVEILTSRIEGHRTLQITLLPIGLEEITFLTYLDVHLDYFSMTYGLARELQ
jgi:hypothetical protein